jgi:UDP-N-acetylglucosamine 4,6-dehydratase
MNKKIFITGGSGYLGKELIKKFYNTNEITIYSRDEAKQYFLKKQYPNLNCIIGDVRNYELLKKVSKNNHIGIFAASLKQIETCHNNYEEAEEIIVKGAFNSRRIAEENNFESACFISSDKSRSATTIYGAMKYVAGESFISGSSNVLLSTAIYGNIVNSTGSILPLIWNSLNNNIPITLYNTEMTRFLLTIDEAISLIEKSLKYTNVNIIPVAKSFLILDLFEIFKENYGLKFNVSTPRSGEKIHEIMASSEEIPRMQFKKEEDIYLLHQQKTFSQLSFANNEYSSKDNCLSKDDLNQFLKKFNYFKP